MFTRWYSSVFKSKLSYPYVHILFGARQTGKSTLINSIIPQRAIKINLADPMQRNRHINNPMELEQICRSVSKSETATVVFIDEVQNVPSMFDSVQYLYDSDKERWCFILCGSSARRLRNSGTNLLPGRSILHKLFPLLLTEQPYSHVSTGDLQTPLPFTLSTNISDCITAPSWDIEQRLAWGSFPGIIAAPEELRSDILKTYANVHLEEEIRREAYIKDWAAFVRFVRLAAAESGKMINYAAISNHAGISQPTVKAYYQLLEDMFLGFTVPAYTKSMRKNILSTGRFFMCDIGIRHAAAGLQPSLETVRADPGPLFEQWVGMELWKRLNYSGTGELYYQKARTGAEVDFIIDLKTSLIPIEVKWTDRPTSSHARHLNTFLDEHGSFAPKGYVICRCPYPLQLTEKVIAIPWFYL